uniref:SWIM-type domain-containing protein n=1 Tax=Mycena chlorophos TaxID=658473 RepID=A0ABQ0LC05_MYCCL|nr:predicted protein [Mycena chlorophos]
MTGLRLVSIVVLIESCTANPATFNFSVPPVTFASFRRLLPPLRSSHLPEMVGVPKVRTLPPNGIPRLDAGDLKTEIYYKKLLLSNATAIVVAEYYGGGAPIYDVVYDHSEDPSAGLDSEDLLRSLGVHRDDLNEDSLAAMGRWFTLWSKHKDSKNPKNPATWSIKRILIQCECGYDHTLRKTKTRHASFPHTGCPAHLEITLHPPTGAILRVRGLPRHNKECDAAMLQHLPRQPVAPVVYNHAIKQLRDGARMRAIFQTNIQFVREQRYAGMPSDRSKSVYRWILNQTNDTRSLLRKFQRVSGVKVIQKAEYNIDGWLDPASPDYNATLAAAIFHYSARTARKERLEICVSTQDMTLSAWKYGHDGQLLLDGTFGVTNSRLLLFIVMVVDERGKGIPVAFLIFSAPTGNQQSSAGYNTEILTKLLTTWRSHLNASGCAARPTADTPFHPVTAITDTDMKERGALLTVFPDIWLLICRFHLKQCWRNHRGQMLKGTSKLISDLKNRLTRFEQLLLEQPDEAAARVFIAREKAVLERSLTAANDGSLPAIATNVVKHLDYLGDAFWLRTGLFNSWSDAGRVEAARRLRCAVASVVPTTNHVEGFNGALKNSHLANWKRAGRRLRPDVFLKILITDIIPLIFQKRAIIIEEESIRRAKYTHLPGGTELIAQLAKGAASDVIPFIAFLPDDDERQIRGCEMVLSRQIEPPTVVEMETADEVERITCFEFTCHSSTALDGETDSVRYGIQILVNGVARCECWDFIRHGWGCKHIRAGLAFLDQLRRQKLVDIRVEDIPFPTTRQQAIDLQIQLGISSRGRLATLSQAVSPAASLADDLREMWSEIAPPPDVTETCPDPVDDSSSPAADVDVDTELPSPLHLPAFDTTPVPAPAPTPTSPPITPSADQAFEAQAISRLLFELPKINNTLSSLGDILRSSQRPGMLAGDQVREAEQFLGLLSSVETQIRRRLDGGMADDQLDGDVVGARRGHQDDTADRSAPKRARLLPPSPEKSQKRKDSHSERVTTHCPVFPDPYHQLLIFHRAMSPSPPLASKNQPLEPERDELADNVESNESQQDTDTKSTETPSEQTTMAHRPNFDGRPEGVATPPAPGSAPAPSSPAPSNAVPGAVGTPPPPPPPGAGPPQPPPGYAAYPAPQYLYAPSAFYHSAPPGVDGQPPGFPIQTHDGHAVYAPMQFPPPMHGGPAYGVPYMHMMQHAPPGSAMHAATQAHAAVGLPPAPPALDPASYSYTDDAGTKLSDRVRRRCFNCCTTETSTWRRSNLNAGKVLCNKCGLFERTHNRPRPEAFPHKRAPVSAGGSASPRHQPYPPVSPAPASASASASGSISAPGTPGAGAMQQQPAFMVPVLMQPPIPSQHQHQHQQHPQHVPTPPPVSTPPVSMSVAVPTAGSVGGPEQQAPGQQQVQQAQQPQPLMYLPPPPLPPPHSANANAQNAASGAHAAGVGPGAEDGTPKKGRGRPKGSKNKSPSKKAAAGAGAKQGLGLDAVGGAGGSGEPFDAELEADEDGEADADVDDGDGEWNGRD